ncbi:hypothetical protein NLG97_g2001 [Lecanicillium saksenae]|uniref:Uncharacterized protein n=1 Tax=Lecanicillium saksenae TaxID=468837 RepID=A0ACC1R3X0_9HYPO|nr:hypothetical protein NLG97_g2001 [Lecanicillium saksenae]
MFLAPPRSHRASAINNNATAPTIVRKHIYTAIARGQQSMSRRAITRRALSLSVTKPLHHLHGRRTFYASALVGKDPRIPNLGKEIIDDFAQLREDYAAPKYPIVLAHGLFGFSELRIGPRLPAVQYWHGIKDALQANGATVFATSVPPSSSIAVRAAAGRHFAAWLAESTVDIASMVDATQEIISFYECYEKYNEKLTREQINRFVKAGSLDR